MAKNENKQESTAEQLAAQLAAEKKAAVDKQSALDEAASFTTMVKAAEKPLADICDAWQLFLDAVKRCDDIVKEQAVAAKAAQANAAQTGQQSLARELGHEPLVATSMANVSKLPWPVVMRPVFYVSQFPDAETLWMNVQLTLNQGVPVHAPGMTSEQIAKAMLSGVRAEELQSKGAESEQLKKLQSDANGWFGFKPKAA